MRAKNTNKRKVKQVKKAENAGKTPANSHVTRRIVGIAVVFASIFIAASMIFTETTGPFGEMTKNLILGLLGMMGIFLPVVVFYAGWIILIEKQPEMYKSRLIFLFMLMVLVSCFLYIAVSQDSYIPEKQFADNLSNFYYEGRELSGGGVIGGMLTVPLIMVFGPVGALILLMTVTAVVLILLADTSLGVILSKAGSFFAGMAGFAAGLFEKKVRERTEKPVLDDKKIIPLNKRKPEFPVIDDFPERKIIDFEKEYEEKHKHDEETQEGKNIIKQEAKTPALKEIQKEARVEELELDHTALKKLDEEYMFPPVEILKSVVDSGKTSSKKELNDTADKLEHTLSSFGVNAKVTNVTRGPTVTRYELSPGAGVKVSKIVGLADDLALNLAAPAVRIEAPIPGKAAVGIEIPNREVAPVYLKDVVESKEFRSFSSNLAFAIGKDIAGKIVVGDIAKMPHLLIAGATGSGKSVCINTLISSIMYKARPDQVKLLLIDPKVVELGVYNGIPHLLIPVVTDPKKAAGALNWAVQEMVSRYNLFADKGVRDIKGYNAALKEEGTEGILPQVVIVIDELADLMMVAPNDVEDAICRLAQMARAAGMHLVVATQRPSVDVITGVIKANIPSRISFAVSSQVDSRTILDMAGAEKLLGKGDMLYYPVGEPKPVRLQGTLVSDKEVEGIVEFIKGQADVTYNEDIIEKLESGTDKMEADSGDNDVLLPQAIDMVVETGQASISIIQRRFKVGYARAARLIDQMEARGIVGGFEGSKPRRVLVSKQQWEDMKAE